LFRRSMTYNGGFRLDWSSVRVFIRQLPPGSQKWSLEQSWNPAGERVTENRQPIDRKMQSTVDDGRRPLVDRNSGVDIHFKSKWMSSALSECNQWKSRRQIKSMNPILSGQLAKFTLVSSRDVSGRSFQRVAMATALTNDPSAQIMLPTTAATLALIKSPTIQR
jgi:hypothetical protein